MKLLITKSKYGLDLPLHTTWSTDEVEFEVLGLAKQEERDGMILQWWIVEEN
jgi:hypothetical protein